MAGEQTQALARIEAAIARIETAALRPRPTEPDAALVTRHADLRAAVAEALGELDAVIEAAST
jgi:hypothetical protein